MISAPTQTANISSAKSARTAVAHRFSRLCPCGGLALPDRGRAAVAYHRNLITGIMAICFSRFKLILNWEITAKDQSASASNAALHVSQRRVDYCQGHLPLPAIM